MKSGEQGEVMPTYVFEKVANIKELEDYISC